MSLESVRALSHAEVEPHDDDEAFRREERSYLAQNPSLQFVAELLAKLRSTGLPWWTAAAVREAWPATVRMRWLKQRPDLRQQVVTKLTGMPPKAARRFWPDEQATLIDAVVDSGDVDVSAFEEAFDPVDMVVYGPASEFWRAFRERMPWEESSPAHQRLAAWMIRSLIADRASVDGVHRRAILQPIDVRAAIPSVVWQTRMPFELRVQIDEARIKHERTRPREPFSARHELGIATPEKIAENIPVSDLGPLVERAEVAMGFKESCEATSGAPPSMDPPPMSQTN